LLNFGKNNKIKQFQIYKLDNWFFRGSYIVLDPKKKADLVNNYLSEKIDDKQDIDNEKIAKVINQKGLFVIISSKKQETENILNLYYSQLN